MHASVEFAVDAIRLGASGFVLKADASSELEDALREILAGRISIGQGIVQPLDPLR